MHRIARQTVIPRCNRQLTAPRDAHRHEGSVEATLGGACALWNVGEADRSDTYTSINSTFISSSLQLVEILQQDYGLPKDAAVESAANFLRAFRARPDDDSFALDEWPAHLWRNCLPKNYRHIAKNISIEWLRLRFKYLALTPDVIHLLETLREDYLLGLITNGPSRAQWQKIERLGLRKYFDCVLVSGDLPWEKPDQHIFLEACKLLAVEPRTCFMVGDKLETDIMGGKEAELGGTVWIPLQKESSDLPDFTIDNVTELPEVLPNSPKLKRCKQDSAKC